MRHRRDRAAILLLACGFTQAGQAMAPSGVQPRVIDLRPGQSPAQALHAAVIAGEIAALRAQWRADHPGAVPAGTPPVVTSGMLLTPTLNAQIAPASPELSVTYATGGAPLSHIFYQFVSNATGQVLNASYSLRKPSNAGTVIMQRADIGALNRYAAAGTWTLTEVQLADTAGNYSFYAGADLAALFPSLTIEVTNARSSDAKKPSIASGKILTPSVSLSAADAGFSAKLSVSDNLSGVYSSYIAVAAAGVPGLYFAYGDIAAPVMKGAILDYLPMSPGFPTGTYTIALYNVCDLADNCVTSSDPADIQKLFGATGFTVTD